MNISEDLIRSSAPYVSNNSYESDDNFYKNQCIDLIQELNTSESIKINQIKPPQNETRYLMLLDRNSPLFFGKLEAIARIYLDLNVLEKYSSRRNKDQRIKDCLEEYGGDYGLDHYIIPHQSPSYTYSNKKRAKSYLRNFKRVRRTKIKNLLFAYSPQKITQDNFKSHHNL